MGDDLSLLGDTFPFFFRMPAKTFLSSLNGDRLGAPGGGLTSLDGDGSCCHQESCAFLFLSAASVGDQELGGGDTCSSSTEYSGGGLDGC